MTDNGKILSALLLGVAIGAVTGLLFAPEKGTSTRKRIQDVLSGLKDKAGSAASDLKDRVMSKAEQMRAEAEEEISNGKQKVKQTAGNY